MYSDSDNEHSTNPVICTNCHSSNFYRDSTTDNLVCYECHTQSQSQSQREVADDDDFFNLAAKTYGKTIRSRNRRVEDHELDGSKSLPDVVDCCEAFQYLLKLAAERAVELSGIGFCAEGEVAKAASTEDAGGDGNGENLEELAKRAMLTLVKEIWFAYLESWQSAVEYFRKMFPEVRFSFRDSFLSVQQKSMIHRHISARILKNAHDAKRLGKADPGWTGKVELNDDDGNGNGNGNGKMRRKRKANSSKNETRKRLKLESESSNSDTQTDGSISTTASRDTHYTGHDHIITNQNGSNNTCQRYYREPLTSVRHMLRQLHHNKDHTVDKNEAALRLEPSMTLIASIVHLALLRLHTGIASFHLTSWAANGSYPYILNAFVHLPRRLQKNMKPIRRMFADKTLPHPAEIDQMTDLLILACDLDMMRDRDNEFAKLQRNNFHCCNTKKLTELFTGRSANKLIAIKDENIGDNQNTTIKEDHVVKIPIDLASRHNKKEDKYVPLQRNEHETVLTTVTTQPSKRHVYQDNVPMMACRFVMDLGLDQCVLDISLALMGMYRRDESKQRQKNQQQSHHSTRSEVEWLPGPLHGASPDRIVSPLHVMAVIVAACKMCPNWEGWQVRLASDIIDSDTTNSIDGGRGTLDKIQDRRESSVKTDDDDDSWTKRFCKYDDNGDKLEPLFKKNKDLKGQRFIPCEDDDINFVGNGRMLEEYLDFVEETHGSSLPVLEQYREDISSIKDVYSSIEKHRDDPIHRSNRGLSVKPNAVLAGAPNPNKPRRIKLKGTNLYHLLLCRHRGATWTDANGFGEYVVYKNLKSHAATKNTYGCYTETTPEPFHPHYGLLIEFAADTMGAEPGELHYLVSALDEEISMLYGRSDLDWNLRHNVGRDVRSRLRMAEATLKKRYHPRV